MEVGREKVHDDIDGEKEVNDGVEHVEEALDVGVLSPLVANLNRQFDAAVNYEENNKQVPLDSEWVVQLYDSLFPEPLDVGPLLFLLFEILQILILPQFESLHCLILLLLVVEVLSENQVLDPRAPQSLETSFELRIESVVHRLTLSQLLLLMLRLYFHDVSRLLLHFLNFLSVFLSLQVIF